MTLPSSPEAGMVTQDLAAGTVWSEAPHSPQRNLVHKHQMAAVDVAVVTINLRIFYFGFDVEVCSI